MVCLSMVEEIHRGGLDPLGLSSSEKEVSFQWLIFDYDFWRTQAIFTPNVITGTYLLRLYPSIIIVPGFLCK